jgi:deoxyhypusine monooxygenase
VLYTPEKKEEGRMGVDAHVERVLDTAAPVPLRFRALFALTNLAETATEPNDQAAARKALETIVLSRDKTLQAAIDPNDNDAARDGALLRHEAAYALGQMGDEKAIPVLISALEDRGENPMVRHEAAEALGAIGTHRTGEAGSAEASEAVLRRFSADENVAVRETCEIALDRIAWAAAHPEHGQAQGGRKAVADGDSDEVYASVDPAPAGEFSDLDVPALREKMLDSNLSLFQRYQAVFALRNRGGDDAVAALCEGMQDRSALFKHEVAYVLGQLQSAASIDALSVALEDASEAPMVRHEAAEALGAIADSRSLPLLEKYRTDENPIVSESCMVGLDIVEYFTSDEFQPTDGTDDRSKEVKILQEKRPQQS